MNTISMEYYLKEYIDNHFEKTYDINDRILSCAIQYDVLLIAKFHNLYYNSHLIPQLLLSDSNIKRKIIGGSQYYLGLKYKNDDNNDMYYWNKKN